MSVPHSLAERLTHFLLPFLSSLSEQQRTSCFCVSCAHEYVPCLPPTALLPLVPLPRAMLWHICGLSSWPAS